MSLLNYIIIIQTIIFVYISKKIFHSLWNICSLMNLIWCFLIIVSAFGILDFYIPSEKTLTYVWLFLFIYSVTVLVSWLCMNHIKSLRKIPQHGDFYINKRRLTAIAFAVWVVFIPTIIKGFNMYINNGAKEIRYSFLQGGASSYMGYYAFYYYTFVLRPLTVATSILAAYVIVRNKKECFRVILIALIGGGLHFFLAGGRKEIFDLLVYIVLLALTDKDKKRTFYFGKSKLYVDKSSYVVWVVLFMMPLLVGGLVIGTMQRLHYGLNVLETFWQYLVGPMSYFNIIIMNPNRFGIANGGFLHGSATYGFITGPICAATAILFKMDYRGSDFLMGIFDNVAYKISPSVPLNATSTIIYTFLADYGMLGWVFGVIQFGFIIALVTKLAEKNSIFWKCIELFALFVIAFSFWRNAYIYSDGYMMIVWFIILRILRVIGNSDDKLKRGETCKGSKNTI